MRAGSAVLSMVFCMALGVGLAFAQQPSSPAQEGDEAPRPSCQQQCLKSNDQCVHRCHEAYANDPRARMECMRRCDPVMMQCMKKCPPQKQAPVAPRKREQPGQPAR